MVQSSRTALRESLAQEICQNGRCSVWGTFLSGPCWLSWLVSSQTSFHDLEGHQQKSIDWWNLLFLSFSSWCFLKYSLKFRLPPKKITQIFPPVDLRIIFFELRLQESQFFPSFWEVPPVLGWTFGWCRHDSTHGEAARVCGLRFANEEVAQLEAGHGLYLGLGGMGDRGNPMHHQTTGGENVHCCCEICSAGRSCSY